MSESQPKMPLERRGISASRIALGCMHFGGPMTATSVGEEQLDRARLAFDTAYEQGIRFFDVADIYGRGKAEQVLGQIVRERPGIRDQIILQTKCGIRLEDERGFNQYDFSYEHIMEAVDGSLSRLGLPSVDILLLHRPDPLVEPEEVAEAFYKLRAAGKVRWFGVSNMSAAQMRFLQSSFDEPLIVNQLELNLLHTGFVDAEIHVNQAESTKDAFPEGSMEYFREKQVQIQAWGPLAQGRLSGGSLEGEPESVRRTAKLVEEMAQSKGTSREAIVLAWLMRHPAGIQPVVGTMNPERIRASVQATQVTLTREEWYQLYEVSTGHALP
jgi:predicted oxidoreductase